MDAEVTEYEGYEVKIYREECTADYNPRECSNLGTMVCFHRKYNLGDKDHGQGKGMNFSNPDELVQHLKEEPSIALPLFLLDHSGLKMRTRRFHGLIGMWDSGQVGVIFVEKWWLRKEYGWKRISPRRRQRAVERLKTEVSVYSQYLEGDIYWYEVLDSDGEVVDTCSGCFGYDYTLREAKSAVDLFCEEENKHE